jgi:intracellular sulfur oxidation DsrE/DsrF family protein
MNWVPQARRSFLSQIGTGLTTVFGVTLVGGTPVEAQSGQTPASAGRFQPVRHAEDDWLDMLPGKHRFIFDTTTPDAFAGSLLYANNFFTANQTAYKLGDSDLAVVIVARHFSTPFAYNDAIWAKYGDAFSQLLKVTDPQSKQAPKINIYNSAALAPTLPSLGNTVDGVLKHGVHFAVCQMATRFFSGEIAKIVKGNADAINSELVAGVVSNSHMVPAGIVAVNRAQERGYSFAYVT